MISQLIVLLERIVEDTCFFSDRAQAAIHEKESKRLTGLIRLVCINKVRKANQHAFPHHCCWSASCMQPACLPSYYSSPTTLTLPAIDHQHQPSASLVCVQPAQVTGHSSLLIQLPTRILRVDIVSHAACSSSPPDLFEGPSSTTMLSRSWLYFKAA